MMRTLIFITVLCQVGIAAGQQSQFRGEVVPLLEAKCIRCHSGSTPKGDLNLTTAKGLSQGGSNGAVIESKKAVSSLLYQMVHQQKMPPKEKLSAAEVEAIRKWIDAGAVWDGPDLKAVAAVVHTPQRAGKDWWSLQPLRRPVVPATGSTWARQAIDHFIVQKLSDRGLRPAEEADRRTYLRRVTFDLIGLPPTPEEIERFLKDDTADAYEKVVDRLLASPHYGERWGRHWLDVVRFAESHGYETNELRRSAWPYRDWVIRAFNEDKPFERFVLEQLAGDAVAAGDARNEVATGFLVGGTHDIVGNQTPEGMAQQRQDDLYDMVSTTGSAFLGLTVNCARCHDHKFDPITQRDYYGMQAVFAGTHHGTRTIHDPELDKQLAQLSKQIAALQEKISGLEAVTSEAGPPRARVNAETFPPVEARFVRFTVLATAINDEPCIDELEVHADGVNVALWSAGGKATASSVYPDSTIHRIEHLNDSKLGNSHSWISNEKGQGWAQIELPKVHKIDRIVWGRDRLMKFTDRLATKYKIEASLDGNTWQLLCTQEDRLKRKSSPEVATKLAELKELESKRAVLDKKSEAIRTRLSVYCGSFKKPDATYVLKRGDPMQLLDKITIPTAISALGLPLLLSDTGNDADRRIALANWITDVRNPLPARVMVNRLWHYHFGSGIVGTPSDFGFNGEKPSHPELLDWLAAEFQSNGGRLKPLHRMMVLSATYRQSSIVDEQSRVKGEKVDAGNRLLWKSPRRRLEAEAVRDATLSVCGNLDLKIGGPGYDLWDYSNYVVVFTPRSPLPAETFRRMVYQFKPRTQQDSTFGSFDCPDGTLSMPRRNVSTTPLQALNMLNSEFMLQQVKRLAARLSKDAGADVNAQIKRAFVLLFAREPRASELSKSRSVVEQFGLEVFCRAMLNANEFLFVD